MKKIISLALILTFATITFGQTATAEATAKAFYSAWELKDKAKIAKLSTLKVQKLRSIKYPPKDGDGFDYYFDGCSDEFKKGVFYCTWRDKEFEWVGVSLTVQKVGKSFKVTNLQQGEFELMK